MEEEYFENFEGADLSGQEGEDPELVGEFNQIAVDVLIDIPCWMSEVKHGSLHDEERLGFLKDVVGMIGEGNLPDWDFIFLKSPAKLLLNPGTQQVAAAALFFNSYPQDSKRYTRITDAGYWKRSERLNDVNPDGFRFDYTYELREESSQQRTLGLHEYRLQTERKG
ncbi:uncharacterized protein LOC109851255 isoform X2 [Asparagus officinalis]|uniref:uncharacterized protein LOC109851255 isoform X2 n=1 Tax=Asparagus officinalis TaxID=4686 RepID=UPI00098E6075|nr:uncharacterized protein LOC109851255 isoform X2 [Asparagus officinalis]XP_020276888.1 uncharacterized protein LOC109851255 isoform X2 [Asparagus officinalis]XP_020276889.1 uncharacterized protein LOC109851255 isoform X3 [Asparagus officinalis]XP_020276890.1 uncharacterized protein LOC109851255 isoform X3 [Asparagus officinalis]XP_020276892.1 uncharacterized protein LOC109851255 isoform X2 [Asparagus officinalis]XP_020276893.1 uncharacterized protein LOC109851255 isoform X2 [Asparagus offici